MAKTTISSLANMLATHSQQTKDVFAKKSWMTATPSGQGNTTVALQEERVEKSVLAKYKDVVEEAVEEVIDVEDEKEERKEATPPNSFIADGDEFED